MLRYAAAIAGVLIAVTVSAQDSVYIHDGFVKGEEFLRMPEVRQRAYAAGIVDGVFLAPLFGAPKSQVSTVERCVEGMSDSQIAAILAKYIRERPARWHEHAHTLAFGALRDSCPR
jgi:hypothetical protein